MINRTTRWIFLFCVLVPLSLACSLMGSQSDTSSPGGQDDFNARVATSFALTAAVGGQDSGKTANEGLLENTATPEPPKIETDPLPLRQGLASLNSYRLTIRMNSTGPQKEDRAEMVMVVDKDGDSDSDHTKTDSISSSVDDPELEETSQETFRKGDDFCQISGKGAEADFEYTRVEPIKKDYLDTINSLMDYKPQIENPVFIAEESLNGVVANHFSFTVSQLGKYSGAEIKGNKGEYWLAKDGQYLVRYVLKLDLTNDKAGTERIQSQLSLELSDINQPVDIEFPADCKK